MLKYNKRINIMDVNLVIFTRFVCYHGLVLFNYTIFIHGVRVKGRFVGTFYQIIIHFICKNVQKIMLRKGLIGNYVERNNSYRIKMHKR